MELTDAIQALNDISDPKKNEVEIKKNADGSWRVLITVLSNSEEILLDIFIFNSHVDLATAIERSVVEFLTNYSHL